jgi:hypothetical protein
MGQRISGPGVGLALPQYLYPSELNVLNTPVDLQNCYQTLAPGDSISVPAGAWYVMLGPYLVVQFLDPITGVWRVLGPIGDRQISTLVSDGFNYRISNLTGCACAAVVTAAGSGYTQSTVTVTSSSGGSTWQAVVGGMVSLTTINNAGSGYGIPPLLFIAAPPVGGVQATGYCTLTSNTVSAVTIDNVGGGYVTAPTAVIVTNPFDPNISSTTAIKPATVTLAVVGSGSIAAVLCTNPGASIASAPTLTIAGGAGTGATVTALRMQTFVSATVASAGTWTGGALLTSVGGNGGTTPTWNNPQINYSNFVPRPMQVLLSGATSLSSVATIYDGGLFLSAPTLSVAPVGGNIAPASTVTVTATYGGVSDTALIQPAP